MRKTWIILLLSAMISLTVAGCSQTTSTAPVDKEEKPLSKEEQKPPTEKEPDTQTNENPQAEVKPEEVKPNEVKPEAPLFEYPDAVRGIYVTSHSAGGAKLPELLKLVDETDLNAMVIDVKDDHGWITFPLEGELAPYSKPFIRDPKALLKTLSEHKIYPIARVVVFKDSVLASHHPEASFREGSQVWKNRRGEAFVNPFMESVWQHNLKVAKLAAELGFQEIQFDYVRFPEGFENRDKILSYSMGNYSKEKLEPRLIAEWEEKKKAWDQEKLVWEQKQMEVRAKERESRPPAETVKGAAAEQASSPSVEANAAPQPSAQPEQPPVQIDPLPTEPPKPSYDAVKARVYAVTDFVEYARKELEPYGVKISVDIFGYTATLPEAPGIGQNFTSISKHVDVISSMIYPSHWGNGYFKIPKPDTEPYRLVEEYVKMEKEKLAQLEQPPISRPWIQDFTASWLGKGNYISYGKKEVEDQIKALNAGGLKEFLIWNAVNSYTPNVDYTP